MPHPRTSRWRSSASSPSACSTATTPRRVTRASCEVIELGEQLGFDSAYCATGTSSPASPRRSPSWPRRRSARSRIAIGTAVTPLGWENPLRLAEDLATVDILSGGRLNPASRRPADPLGRRQGRALP